jgi:uncharacterized membrane protein YkvA (DUF1232 family)
MLSHLKPWARRLSRDGRAIYLAARDPRVPWYVKFLPIAVAGYALSPIDFIPDFIPIIGYLDDLIIVPLGIWLVVSLIPNDVMVECRAKADAAGQQPVSRTGMIAIIVVWIAMGLMLGWIGYVSWSRPDTADIQARPSSECCPHARVEGARPRRTDRTWIRERHTTVGEIRCGARIEECAVGRVAIIQNVVDTSVNLKRLVDQIGGVSIEDGIRR